MAHAGGGGSCRLAYASMRLGSGHSKWRKGLRQSMQWSLPLAKPRPPLLRCRAYGAVNLHEALNFEHS